MMATITLKKCPDSLGMLIVRESILYPSSEIHIGYVHEDLVITIPQEEILRFLPIVEKCAMEDRNDYMQWYMEMVCPDCKFPMAHCPGMQIAECIALDEKSEERYLQDLLQSAVSSGWEQSTSSQEG